MPLAGPSRERSRAAPGSGERCRGPAALPWPGRARRTCAACRPRGARCDRGRGGAPVLMSPACPWARRLAPGLIICSPWTAGPQPRDVLRLARLFGIARLGRRDPSPATSCGSHDYLELLASDGGTPAPRRPAARTTIWNCSPWTAGPQPRDVLRLARLFGIARLGRRGPSPATSCGSHDYLELLALDGGAPAPRRPAARTTIWNCSPWTAGPQPRD